VIELKAIHIMCKRDTESVKVAPESALSNRRNIERTHLTRFLPGGGLSPGVYLHTPATAYTAQMTTCVMYSWWISNLLDIYWGMEN